MICTSLGAGHLAPAWVLSRTPPTSLMLLYAIFGILVPESEHIAALQRPDVQSKAASLVVPNGVG